MKVIFLTIYPFNEDYALKYGFEIFKERGFEIKILNISPLIYNDEIIKRAGYASLCPLYGVDQTLVKSGKEFVEKLKFIEGPKIAILVLHPYLRILRYLKKAKVDYIRIFLNQHPGSHDLNSSISERYLKNIRLLLTNPSSVLKKIFNKCIQRIPVKYMGGNKPKYEVLSGNVIGNKYDEKGCKKIFSHSFDYDRYLHNKPLLRDSNIPSYKYFVFLSCSMWDIHDYILENKEFYITKEEYKKTIQRSFDCFEEKTGRKIVIAAGPKGQESENVYGGRPYKTFQTEQLIKYSDGVICHYSGAINFAVIHNKPICFTTLSKLDNDKYFTKYVRAYANELGAKINYIDSEEDLKDILSSEFFYFDRDNYKNYLNKYLKSQFSKNEFCWEKVANVLIDDYVVKQ